MEITFYWDNEESGSFTASEMLECYELDAENMLMIRLEDYEILKEADAWRVLKFWAKTPYSVRHAH